ncbi:hypothetical protein G7077_05600 [Sphingomonas piscis]|uniref:TonB-dependent receptor n=1 Tax=Sphingomonas piscis TaxID=2714943 RepID=A0A6G7YNY5_9SPHN|nr:hypothetical protein [Sphingomonas piscis]QIK78452.1 hypothetical protein G7077_05600 [Sphingomonas piscis]
MKPFVSRGAAFLLCTTLLSGHAHAQDSAPPPAADDPNTIVVTGYRGSAIKKVAPLATLDEEAIAATGASSMSDLLKAVAPVTKSADGSDPIFLLNGQRISSYQEVGTLPPEAIAKMEVLPEPEALRFGYPPTRRVLNFITKPQFQQTEINLGLGTTTHLGGLSGNAKLGVTRLRGSSRLSLNLEHKRTGTISLSEREVLANPDIVFDAVGNITAMDGGEIDPALSALAGTPVTVAPVPTGAALTLGNFAGDANRPRLFLYPGTGLSPENHTSKAEVTWGDRIGQLGASLSLGAERSRNDLISGPSTARLLVPSTIPYSPFGSPVVLNRYLTEADLLTQSQVTTKLRGAGTLRGAIAGWRWDLTGSVEQQVGRGISEIRYDVGQANAAIAAGANPFIPLDPALLGDPLTNRSRLRTRTIGAKSVVTNSPLHLPAGDVSVTATAEVERATASSRTRGADPFRLDLGRTRKEGSLALDIPIASRDDNVLPWAGTLSLNGSATARHIGGYGMLTDRTAGLSWTPRKRIQLLLQDKSIGTAPPLDQLSSPASTLIDIPVFDYTAGRTELVTLTTGGNPDLKAERRRTRSLAVNWQPWEKRQWRVSATYEDVTIRNQTGLVRAVTPRAESVLPDLFVRDPASDRLTAVFYRPTNFYEERLKQLNVVFSLSGTLGKEKPQGKDGKSPPQLTYYGGVGPTYRFTDKLRLRPGTAAFDLLNGDTIQGWNTGRFSTWYYFSLNHPAINFHVDGWMGGRYRVLTGNPASDLYYSSLIKLNASTDLNLFAVFQGREWARKLHLKLEVENLLDSWARAEDGFGNVPVRNQRAFSDPVGRTVTLSLRKRFNKE